MKTNIITISREFGSGGRSIAKALSERLKIAYYDKELVKQVAAETGFDRQFIEEQGEYASDKKGLAYIFQPKGMPGVMNGLSASDFLWMMQREVILKLADKGPCVIVGRCADFILRERGDCLNVYIHASAAFRAERIVRLYGATEKSPEERLKEKDEKRRVNYRHYTGQEWGMSQNYHLCLDSGVLGIEECVGLIARVFGAADVCTGKSEKG